MFGKSFGYLPNTSQSFCQFVATIQTNHTCQTPLFLTKKNWQSYLELRVYLDCNAGSPDQFFGRASVWIRARICNHANYLVTAFCFCTRVLAKWWRQISPPNRWRAKFWQGSLRRNPNSPLIQTDT